MTDGPVMKYEATLDDLIEATAELAFYVGCLNLREQSGKIYFFYGRKEKAMGRARLS
jgi:hypothetical protein